MFALTELNAYQIYNLKILVMCARKDKKDIKV